MFASKDLFFSKPSGGYQISRSVRLRSSATAYFSRTPATTSNRQTWTWSAWVKRGTLGTQQDIFDSSNGGGTVRCFLSFITSNALYFQFDAATASITTTSVYRDTSAWYHIILAVDSTQATASNRLKLYVNGSQITAGTFNYPSLNANSELNIGTQPFNIGRYSNAGEYVDGYLTEINFVDGQQLTPSSFGETNSVTGVWQPKKYGGTYGTNGFYLNFSDNSSNTSTTIGKDYSGNGNNWTPNNISVTAGVTYDSMLDSPTVSATSSNYATLNPLNSYPGFVSAGNLKLTSTGANWYGSAATIGITSGKWYWEVFVTATGATGHMVGIALSSTTFISAGRYPGELTTSYGYYSATGNKYNNGAATAYGATYTTNDVIGVALDLSAGTLTMYKNNVSQGTLVSSLSGEYVPVIATYDSGEVLDINFGQRPFTYTPPTGFVALNTQNLPTPTITNGATVMAASTYTGTGATQTIANSGNNAGSISFKPDLVWIKSRSAATNNNLFDSVRGATNYLISNSTAAEATNANTLTAFGTTGFTLGSDASALGVNVNAATYVGWQWNAGGNTVSNTSGSITSSVRANPTAGFSVVTYTGTGANATVGHGLGVAPKMLIVKLRSPAGGAWAVYHASVGAGSYLFLDQTVAASASAIFWNNTTPTSSVFSIGTNGNVNQANPFVAYCFSEVAGFSKFGSYTGNGSADGPFVFTNFQPRWVMVKRTDSTSDWYIWDTSRDTYNVESATLLADTAGAETSAASIDGLSNGFKCRSATVVNASGGTYIFAAFSSSPFKLSLAR